MNEKGKNSRLAFFVLVIAIIFGIYSVVAMKPQVPDDLGEFFPPAEEISYLSVTAEGEGKGEGVTRVQEELQALHTIAEGIAIKDEQKAYVGKDYEGTLYHLEMGYANSTYDFYIATDGSIYHANGKYEIADEADTTALFAWFDSLIA